MQQYTQPADPLLLLASLVVWLLLRSLQGPNYAVVSACASGSHCIGEAAQMITTGQADMMLAGGTEATITPLVCAGFAAMKAMCTAYNDDPASASRPFDAKRGGFVMGEGAGVVLLER